MCDRESWRQVTATRGVGDVIESAGAGYGH